MVKEEGSADGHIQLFTGLMFDPLNPDPNRFTVEDIAHAGSYMARYAGHCKKFYSVNEHAIHVSCMLEMWGATIPVQLQGLFHDADEGLGLPDMPRPIKVKMPEYKKLGEHLQQVVFEKLGLGWPMDPLVHVADNSILFLYEKPKLMPGNDEYWRYDGELRKADIFIPCWQPEKAKYMFLQRYNYLMKRLNGN